MSGNAGLSSVLVINGKALFKRKGNKKTLGNIIASIFVVVSTEKNSFETITEDMKYKDSFHRLPLKKERYPM